MKKITFFILIIVFKITILAVFVSAQELKHCGTTEEYHKFIKQHPELIKTIEKNTILLENHTEEYITNIEKNKFQRATGTVYTIPVVFHIIHNYGQENISDAQIFDAMRILNEDFRKLNADTSEITDAFKAVAEDAEIEFRLAQLDPQGNCTNGIDRIASPLTNDANDESKLNTWARNKYLNIWVVRTMEDSNVAGYSRYPAWVTQTPDVDGVIIKHEYIGSIGSGDKVRSRALTHEIGHWINLSHPWGDNNQPAINCGDDNVKDTPVTKGWKDCSNKNGSVCNPPIIENVQNFMEYSYCDNMFTKGQTQRLRAALTSSVSQRNNLWTTANRKATGTDGNDILCKAEWTAKTRIICAGDSIHFEDKSYFGQTDWKWKFEGGSPSTSSSQNPTITYSTVGTYPVELKVSNNQNKSESTTKTNFVTVLPAVGKQLNIDEYFENGTTDWVFVNEENRNVWALTNEAAYSGKNSIVLNNFSLPDVKNSVFVSKTIDLTNLKSSVKSLTLSFRAAFAQRETDNTDALTIYVSYNCGQTWQIRKTFKGRAMSSGIENDIPYIPADISDWNEYEVTTIAANNSVANFRLKFEYKYGGGNNIFIDDIKLYDPANPTPTGNIELEIVNDEKFKVYPNPNDGKFIVEVNNLQFTIYNLQLFNLLGKIVYQQALNKKQEIIHLEHLTKGIYFLKLQTEEHIYHKKIIIQ